LSRTGFAYTIREPLGVCVGIGAWNYPSQIACWKSAPALALGNAMVFKPSEVTPLGALKLAEIFVEAGLPAGLFNVVQGRGAVGAALVTDARVAKVSLTGSVPTGQKVYAAAAAGVRHVTMELGGKSPLIVFDDASVEDAVGAAMLGNFYSAGQVCSNGTRVFVQKGIKDRFLARLAERSAKITLGDPLDEGTQMGPLVSAVQLDKVLGYIAQAKAEGARLITGGEVAEGQGYFVQPTVFADVIDTMTLAQQEVFGPVLAVLDFETEADAVRLANATPYGLASGVFTRNLSRAHRLSRDIRAGVGWINTYRAVSPLAPFGGFGLSGSGREGGLESILDYTRTKTVWLRTSDDPIPDPFVMR